jgi:hypothetical protein
MFLQREATALVSAALRHARDAEWLAHPDNPRPSPDQAWHLAGYGPECARKATLLTRAFDRTIGHRFQSGGEDVLDIATALDPFALRYEPGDWARRFPALTEWRETARYERTGGVAQKRHALSDLVRQARHAVDAVVAALWADGRFADHETPL